jgi:hypothetical protein
VNVAVTDLAAVMETTQEPVPLQAPPQPLNVYPLNGEALRVTDVPEEYEVLQEEVQFMPEGPDVTVPVPEAETDTLRE